MSTEINFARLADPFPAADIEWRLQDSGKSTYGIWARCFAYLTNRAIQQRLDDVVGPENWKNEYREWSVGDQRGVLCGISIRVNGDWVTKWDGAGCTKVEPIKGGLSDAMKRAAVQWQIGRYLYHLDIAKAQIVSKSDDAYWGKTKAGEEFYWVPPQLPLTALPEADRDRLLGKGQDVPQSNGNGSKKKPEQKLPVDDGRPGSEISSCAKALVSVAHAPDAKTLTKFSGAIKTRIENGEWTVEEVKQLEDAIALRRKQLRMPDETGADEPDQRYIKSTAKKLGCPDDLLDMIAVLASKQPDVAAYLKTLPWVEEHAAT